MAINDYEQMSLFVDGEPSEKDKSEEMIPALNFNFCNLFVEPLRTSRESKFDGYSWGQPYRFKKDEGSICSAHFCRCPI